MAVCDTVGIVVRDMAASLKFYRLLGMDIPTSADTEPHVEYNSGKGFVIDWDTLELIKSIYPDWVDATGQRTTLGIRCADAAEVNALYERVIQNGYKGYREPWDTFWGQRYAVIIDPDGNLLDIFANL
jgi:catechol 2,3-dioxygenase-like lactoylglutathione lyase family enzyme